MSESPGKIFLADQRGLSETSAIRRYSTFNYDQYFSEHKEAFEQLFICNDEFIAGGKLTFFLSRTDSFQVFILITGGIDVVSKGNEYSVDTGQVLVLNLDLGEVLEISNPYPNEVINYIQLGIKNTVYLMEQVELLADFELENHPNQLLEIVSLEDVPFRLSIGRFAGREEAVHTLKKIQYKFFIFVIDGAFEIEGRLMHARDGLALWDTEKVELEALSNHAIVIVVEMI